MENNRQCDNFDVFAENYRDTHDKCIKLSGADSNYFSEYKIVELKNQEKQRTSSSILDFGCGDGNSCVYIRKHFENKLAITGIDISSSSIDIANKRKIPNASFKDFDGTKIPYDDNSFDIVFTSMVFHHISFDLHEKLMLEIHRVLKKGGRFYIFEHNPKNPLTRKVVNECVFDEDAVLLQPKYAVQLIDKAGFNTTKLNFTLFLPRLKLINWLIPYVENLLKWLPIGAQYYVLAVK